MASSETVKREKKRKGTYSVEEELFLLLRGRNGSFGCGTTTLELDPEEGLDVGCRV